jgi:hypothetical protein
VSDRTTLISEKATLIPGESRANYKIFLANELLSDFRQQIDTDMPFLGNKLG